MGEVGMLRKKDAGRGKRDGREERLIKIGMEREREKGV